MGGGGGDGRCGLEKNCQRRGVEERCGASGMSIGTQVPLADRHEHTPEVLVFSSGRRQLSARGDATTGVRDGWPPEVIFFLLYLLFCILFFYS